MARHTKIFSASPIRFRNGVLMRIDDCMIIKLHRGYCRVPLFCCEIYHLSVDGNIQLHLSRFGIIIIIVTLTSFLAFLLNILLSPLLLLGIFLLLKLIPFIRA